jgi:Asp-tRNA(Asn)/Glu-tRNA(Gln) amidotransferase B subunit
MKTKIKTKQNKTKQNKTKQNKTKQNKTKNDSKDAQYTQYTHISYFELSEEQRSGQRDIPPHPVNRLNENCIKILN